MGYIVQGQKKGISRGAAKGGFKAGPILKRHTRVGWSINQLIQLDMFQALNEFANNFFSWIFDPNKTFIFVWRSTRKNNWKFIFSQVSDVQNVENHSVYYCRRTPYYIMKISGGHFNLRVLCKKWDQSFLIHFMHDISIVYSRVATLI